MFAAIKHSLNQAAAVAALIGGGALLLIIAVTVTNTGLFILDRISELFGANVSGLSGYEDFVGLATGSAVLLLMPYCQTRHGHLSVDILERLFPAKLNTVLEQFWCLVMVIVVTGLGVALFFGMLETQADQAISRVLGWPVWPFYLPGLLGLGLWAAVTTTQLIGGSAHD